MIRIIAIIGLVFAQPAFAKEFSSSQGEKLLLELFTSEGCSSCPPADAWISQLKKDKRLWKSIFPLSFHVDYWDRLGWKDRFASADFTQRQYQYKRNNHIRSVYTPGFVTNGREWRGWFRRNALPKGVAAVGTIQFKVNHQSVNATYLAPGKGKLQFNMALLGMNIQNAVKDGENQGKILKHDFVVLDYQKQSFNKTHNSANTSFLLSPSVTVKDKAIIVWVSDSHGQPLQISGGYITR